MFNNKNWMIGWVDYSGPLERLLKKWIFRNNNNLPKMMMMKIKVNLLKILNIILPVIEI